MNAKRPLGLWIAFFLLTSIFLSNLQLVQASPDSVSETIPGSGYYKSGRDMQSSDIYSGGVELSQGWSTDDIFKDDFEAYAVGTFPSAGGWRLVWDGRGNQYQTIVDTVSVSGSKSFQLWGKYLWSAVAERRFTTNAKIIGFEAYVRVEDYPTKASSANIGFWNREKATWGKYYATVVFTADRFIQASSKKLQLYVPDTWYKIRLVLDRSTNTFSVWIDDELKASDLKTADSYEINAIVLVSNHGGVQCYYDNIRIFTVWVPPQALLWAVIGGIIAVFAIICAIGLGIRWGRR